MKNPVKGHIDLPQLDPVSLEQAGAVLHQSTIPSTLANGHLLITGEVERTTTFEKYSEYREVEYSLSIGDYR